MVCLQCGTETRVSNSRPQKRTNQVWRRRVCLHCGSTFTTEEKISYDAVWLVEQNGTYQPFSRDCLLISLHSSLQHRKTAITDASSLADTIMQKLRPQVQNGHVSAQVIRQAVIVALNRFDKVAGVHYRAFHHA